MEVIYSAGTMFFGAALSLFMMAISRARATANVRPVMRRK